MRTFRITTATVFFVASAISLARAEDAELPTEAECRTAALAAEKMVAEGKVEKWDSWFRRDLMLDAAIQNCPGEESFKKSFRDGAVGSKSIGASLAKMCAAGDRWTLLRLRQEGNSWHAIFRLSGAAGFSYHDFKLARRDGIVCAVDMTLYAQGEPFSRIVRREYMKAQAAATKDRSKLSEWERQYLESIPILGEVNDLMKAGQYEDALKKIAGLPESQRKERFVLSQRLSASLGLGGEQLKAAIEDWRAAFPDDSSLDLLMISQHLANSDFGAAIESVRKLDKVVGGDPYLSFYEGRIHVQKGDAAAARIAFQRAIDGDRTLWDPYYELLVMGLKAKDWPEITRLLVAAEKSAGARVDELLAEEDFKAYAATDECKRFLEERKKEPK